MPSEIIFIFKAMHIIGIHNARSGGSTRHRLKQFTYDSIDALADHHTFFYRWWLLIKFWFKLFVFEKSFWLYQKLFGWVEIKFDENNKAV